MHRKFSHTQSLIKINGKMVNARFARIMYRCADCLGKLGYKDNGLVCLTDPDHHNFIHQRQAERIAAEREAAQAALGTVYEIVDGKIVVKES